MRRLFTIAVCILSLQLTHAATRLKADSTARLTKSKADTIIRLNPLADSYQNSIFKIRLDSIKKDVPLDYNEYVQNYIDIYSRHKDEMGHVLGLAKYYFPIYEKAFREAGIPEEIKYLSIVESKLDPTAVSRVGATGPWQFMPATGKLYGLANDSYVDDRRDPVQASYAAAAYLKDAYMEFGDWLLAIASYNCGKSNVERAIAKAGALDFWSIRQYLPNETRNYVPAYIAVSYVMNYAAKHNIVPQTWSTGLKTDTVLVDRFISLSNISRVLNFDLHELAILNPSYKRQIINGSVAIPKRLVIPQTGTQNYAALYDVLNSDAPLLPVISVKEIASAPAYHKIKHGETLMEIADQYNVDLQDLKDWNNLHGNKAETGKKLWLNDSHELASAPVKKEAKFVTYKVKEGDTLSAIADKFDGATIDSIKTLNGLKKGAIQPGMTLKISRG